MLKVIRPYFSLSPEQRTALREKKISGECTPDDWLKTLRPLVKFERKANLESSQSAGGFLVLACIVLAMVGWAQRSVLGVVIALFLPACWIACRYLRGQITLPGEHLARAVMPMLLVLREDMAPDTKLSLALDLRGLRDATKVTGEKNLPGSGRITQIELTTYLDHWIEGHCVLADGTQLSWSVDEHLREIKRSKRNPRGKTKSKTKFKCVTRVKLRLGLRSDRYALRPLHLSASAARPLVETTEKRLWFKLQAAIRERDFSPDDFVGPIIKAYSHTQPV